MNRKNSLSYTALTLVNRVNPVKADWRINPPVRSFTMKTRPVQSEGSRLTEEGEIIGFH